MFDKVVESKNESSNRRGFLHRIFGLGAAAGAASLLLNRDKALLPLAQAGSGAGDNVQIDYWNTGGSSTTIESNVGASCAFRAKNINGADGSSALDGWASALAGETKGVHGQSDSIFGTGVYGYASNSSGFGTGVWGRSDSMGGIGVYGGAAALTGETYGVYGASDTPNGIGLIGKAGDTRAIPLVARGVTFVFQTANLQEWQDGSHAVLSVVNKDGYLGIGTNNPEVPIKVASSSSNPAIKIVNENNHVGQFIYCYSNSNIPFFSGRRARGIMSSPSAVQTDDVLMRYGGAGYGSSNFASGNRAILEFKAAQTWTDTNQGTYITFSTTLNNSATAAERMRITDAGEIVPPTDNTGSIGTASKRWNLIRGATITSGDLVFENGVRATEEGKGLAFLNDAGQKIAVLDSEGNFRVKGKVIEGL